MRPHRLRMTAFGPFAGTVEVDIDALAASGLFLLHGDTGAGKTTVLDGLGFALYGRVPGARGRTGRLRSDHADPSVRTEVVLEVTLGGRLWRITRSPAQERAKARGTGTTTEQARVLLEVREAGDWQTVSTRLDEAAAELDPLLGMSADQFFQVVLLPQGEFARFLRAESRERGQLLQRLFATERFHAVEDWLAGRRVSTAAAVTAARGALRVVMARLCQAAGAEQPCAADDAPPEHAALAAWTAAVTTASAHQTQEGGQAVALASAARDAARAVAAELERLADRQSRRRSALASRQELERTRGDREREGEELLAAARAAELAPVLTQEQLRAQARADALAGEQVARAALPGVGIAVDLPLSGLVTSAAAARERSGRFEALRGLADDLAAERGAQALAERDARGYAAAVERGAAALAALPARRDQAQGAVLAARAAAELLPAATARVVAITAALAEARGLAGALAELAGLREAHVRAREKAVLLREAEAALREARLDSMLAELADTLQADTPCAVCGSLVHPDPFEGAGAGVSRDDEERARRAAQAAARDVAEAEARIAAAGARVDGHHARLVAAGLGEDAGLLAAECTRADGLAGGLRQRAADLPAALAALEQVESEQVSADAALARAVAEGSAAARRRDEARARATRLDARLTTELDGAPDLSAALAGAVRTAQQCAAAVEAGERSARDAAEAALAAAAATTAASAAGFASPDAARGALRSAAWREQAGRQQREHDDRRAAVAAALADPELAVALDPPAQLEPAAAALRQADLALEVAVGALAAARARAAQVGALAPQVLAAAQALQPLEEQAGRVRRLADLCGGGGANALKMTLSSFVLAARLEEVALAASGKLLRMTQGRYALVHTDGAAKGGARSGLGLLVRDSWTGRDRETSTLSGGETFQASLALALGLADVVQAEAGGTRIEALFVDEGFGSLDEQTLDEVMDVLDGLREGGRVVGLVSHVAELKARIPAQVLVSTSRTGSTLTVTGC